MTGERAATIYMASMDVVKAVFIIVMMLMIVGFKYTQVMFQPGYSFTRHLVTVAIIASISGVAILAIRLIA